jgi:hypothetical protein
MLREIKIVSKERHTPSRFIAPYYYAALQGEERKPSKKGKTRREPGAKPQGLLFEGRYPGCPTQDRRAQ